MSTLMPQHGLTPEYIIIPTANGMLQAYSYSISINRKALLSRRTVQNIVRYTALY
jgi:hypothetical protein